MKILIVSEDIPHGSMGGLAQHALALARALEGAGHSVDILGNGVVPYDTVSATTRHHGSFISGIEGHLIGWKESQLGFFNPYKRTLIAQRISKAITSIAPEYDVIHYHGHYPEVANYIAQSVNFVQTRHDQGGDCLINTRLRDGQICTSIEPETCASCINQQPNVLQRAISSHTVVKHRKATSTAYQRHKTIFVSECLIRNHKRVSGTEHPGVVIHNFIDYESIRHKVLSIHEDCVKDRFVLVPGKLYAPKGVADFLRSIRDKIPDGLSIVIAGDGPDEHVLRQSYADDRIRFLGWMDYIELLRYAIRACAIVVPSIWEEPCATTILESLALGKQTFALNRGGTPELTRYARYQGQLVLANSMDMLTEIIMEYDLHRPERHQNLPEDFSGDVKQRLAQIIEVYQS